MNYPSVFEIVMVLGPSHRFIQILLTTKNGKLGMRELTNSFMWDMY